MPGGTRPGTPAAGGAVFTPTPRERTKYKDSQKFENPLVQGEQGITNSVHTVAAADHGTDAGTGGVRHQNAQPEPEPDRPMVVTPETLSDLSFAFMACDFDRSGSVEASELVAILNVLGSECTMGQIMAVMQQSKDGFEEWCSKQSVDDYKPGDSGNHPDDESDHIHGDRQFGELNMESKKSSGFLGRCIYCSVL